MSTAQRTSDLRISATGKLLEGRDGSGKLAPAALADHQLSGNQDTGAGRGGVVNSVKQQACCIATNAHRIRHDGGQGRKRYGALRQIVGSDNCKIASGYFPSGQQIAHDRLGEHVIVADNGIRRAGRGQEFRKAAQIGEVPQMGRNDQIVFQLVFFQGLSEAIEPFTRSGMYRFASKEGNFPASMSDEMCDGQGSPVCIVGADIVAISLRDVTENLYEGQVKPLDFRQKGVGASGSRTENEAIHAVFAQATDLTQLSVGIFGAVDQNGYNIGVNDNFVDPQHQLAVERAANVTQDKADRAGFLTAQVCSAPIVDIAQFIHRADDTVSCFQRDKGAVPKHQRRSSARDPCFNCHRIEGYRFFHNPQAAFTSCNILELFKSEPSGEQIFLPVIIPHFQVCGKRKG